MPEPVLSVAAMLAREQRTWEAGIRRESVIRRAGAAVAGVVMRLTRAGDPVLVLAGPGNNGEDAAVCEEHLGDRDAVLVRLTEQHGFDAACQWLDAYRDHPRAVVVDGIFGIGLNRDVEGAWADLIGRVNASGARVFSVDVPSGLDADTGMPRGAAVRASVTVTLGSVKRGLLLTAAAGFVGRLELAREIGLAPTDALEDGGVLWVVAEDFGRFPPARCDSGHKGDHGHLAVVAGSLGYHGAAVLAAEGALRARPGLVTVFTDPRCYSPVAAQLRAAMVRPWTGEVVEAGYAAVVLGPGLASPGLSPAVREEAARLWREHGGWVVADASALDWLPRDLGAGAGGRVITPHPGEAGRLLGETAAAVQADRIAAVRALAGFWPVRPDLWVVLKGRHTVIGRREGPVWVNGTGNPGLGQGGTGDVLAGYLGGLLAQPRIVDPGLAIRYAVWRHGWVADGLEESGRFWTAEDLVAALA